MSEGAPRFNPKEEKPVPAREQGISELEQVAKVLEKRNEGSIQEKEPAIENPNEDLEIHPSPDLSDTLRRIQEKE